MQRLQDPTAVATEPARPTLTGPTGFFTNGNPASQVPATDVQDWWLNMVQEELAAILTAAGMPLDNSKTVLQALEALFVAVPTFNTTTASLEASIASVQALIATEVAQSRVGTRTATFATPGTSNWSVPAGVYGYWEEIWGPGGAGGGSTTGGAGGGGGGGGYVRSWIGVNPTDVVAVAVGQAGTPGNGSGSGATVGTATSCTSPLGQRIAYSGGPGGGAGSGALGIGGASGTTTGGDESQTGGQGGQGEIQNGVSSGGPGGWSHQSSGVPGSIAQGVAGAGPGGGGGGGGNGGGGGTGGGGYVRITY